MVVPVPDVEKNGSEYSASSKKMTPERLQDICKERNMWALPHLNTQLYLNYKGFDEISGLESYIAVKTLHLGNNNIAKIEGLDRMSALRSLHLEGNRITCIENLAKCLELKQLNLEGNAIERVEGLSSHAKLEQLNLAHNSIGSLEDLDELRCLPSLSNIDVSHNSLEDVDGVVDFWAGLASPIRLLRYQANPGVRKIEHYRKRMINALPMLSYLDERPVFPVERKSSKAWSEGGIEAMHAAKREFARERDRMQCGVEPERRELLTRMRQLALARIEREAREKEAAADAAAEAARDAAGGSAAVAAGEAEALNTYAKRWQEDLAKHGAEAVRARERESAAGGAPARHQFAPEPRGRPDAGAAAALAREPQPPPAPADAPPGPPSGATAPASAARRAAAARPAGAADFRVRDAGAPAGAGGWQERQFAVLGDTLCQEGPGAAGSAVGGSASAGLTAGRPVPGGAAAWASGQRGAAGPEVLPVIWQGRQEQNAAEELQCLEKNFATCGDGRSRGEELSSLD